MRLLKIFLITRFARADSGSISLDDLSSLLADYYGWNDDVDECSDGTHNCVTNAVCNDSDDSFDCSCASGFFGDATVECEDCSATYNCNRSRGLCGGSLFVDSADYEADLISCLAGFTEEEIQFNGQSFVAKRRKYYKEIDGDSFIYYDQSYGIWRLGGGSEPTVPVDCATVPICN